MSKTTLAWLLALSCSALAAAPAPQCAKDLPPLKLAQSQPVASQPGLPWWRQAVFYEVFVRSFADSTSGPLACDGIGDLQGLIDKLDYLNDGNPETTEDLGVTALWLMPIFQSPSYHGYDPIDSLQLNPEYGTVEDLRRLIEAAHSRGIRVILDFMLNHTSEQNPKFIASRQPDSPYRDWFLWKDQKPDYYWGSWAQPIWHDTRKGSYFATFSGDLPDWNLNHPEVKAELYRAAEFWAKELNVDGYRLDAIRYMVETGEELTDTPATHQWLKEFNQHLKTNPDFFLVGEVWADTDTIATYGTDQVDMAFQFDLASALLNGVNQGSAGHLGSVLQQIGNALPGFRMATFLSNHDTERSFSQLQGSEPKARLALSLLLSLPGVPFLYYGEELGMTGRKPDPDLRTPMQWDGSATAGFSKATPWYPLPENHQKRHVAQAKRKTGSLLHHYRDWIQWRNQEPALRIGEFRLLDSGSDSQLAFVRSWQGRQLLVLANLAAKPSRVRPDKLALSECSTAQPDCKPSSYRRLQPNQAAGPRQNLSKAIALPGLSLQVFELK